MTNRTRTRTPAKAKPARRPCYFVDLFAPEQCPNPQCGGRLHDYNDFAIHAGQIASAGRGRTRGIRFFHPHYEIVQCLKCRNFTVRIPILSWKTTDPKKVREIRRAFSRVIVREGSAVGNVKGKTEVYALGLRDGVKFASRHVSRTSVVRIVIKSRPQR